MRKDDQGGENEKGTALFLPVRSLREDILVINVYFLGVIQKTEKPTSNLRLRGPPGAPEDSRSGL